ncbi:MAG: signal transduction histidine kinase/DNA-binding response OmpR family regulator [Flavobacteriales bacterium]|jgi:signal transduction histidine kinase/DNA-binding response OmpR family regulator/HPt (histidine-containing phosphotransfer) domain-containing protein
MQTRLDRILALFDEDRFAMAFRIFAVIVPLQLAVLAFALGLRSGQLGFQIETWLPTIVVVALLSVAIYATHRAPNAARLRLAAGQAALTVTVIHICGVTPITVSAAMISIALIALFDDWRMITAYAALHVSGVWIVAGSMHLVAGDPQWVFVATDAMVVTIAAVPVALRCVLTVRKEERFADEAKEIECRNEELRDLEVAEQAARAKTEFLANMSHEIRTPLSAIRGFAELLSDPKNNPTDTAEYIRTIRRNSDHLLTIINDILDLSKIEAGKMSVELLATEPAAILSDVISLMRMRAEDKGLVLSASYRTPVPQTIQTDPTRLRQILLNLVSNALKFTSEGGVSLDVTHNPEQQLLAFTVRDTGIGLTEEQRYRLFSAFSQADTSTTRKFGGTGLGLVISQQMAEMLGGSVDVESVYGEGCAFTVRVATGLLADGEIDEAFVHQVQTDDESKKKPLIDCSGARVLYAEDGIDNQRLVSAMISRAGGGITVVENGLLAVDEALSQFDNGTPYDIILMDIQMPVMDGYTATRTLRDSGYSGQIVALTSHAMATERQKCIDAGCSGYLNKPVDRDALIATIRDARKSGGASSRATTLTLPVRQTNNMGSIVTSTALSGHPHDEARPHSSTLALPVSTTTVQSAPVKLSPAIVAQPAHLLAEVSSAAALTEPPLTMEPLRSTMADDNSFVDLILGFAERLEPMMNQVREARQRGDAKEVCNIAHQLKGAAGGYGFQPLTEAARTLESAAEAGDATRITEALRVMEHLVTRILVAHPVSPESTQSAA